MSNTDLNVALNEGAYKDLLDIWGILPSKLAAQLDASTPPKDSPSPTPTSRPVPYTVLLSISRWARTDSGRDALLAHQPPKDPRNFDMIALLAGSTTSPEKHFPTPVGGWAEEERTRKREMNDRRAITNVINAMLSIGGCGVATWYAAGVAGWQNEWCVLLGLLAATVVAIAEAVLYIIWTNASSNPRRPAKLRKRPPKRDESPSTSADGLLQEGATLGAATSHDQDQLRRRGAISQAGPEDT